MQRINGFLNLDEYFNEIKNNKSLSDVDLETLGYILPSDYKWNQCWLKINNEYYYFKVTRNLYHELIVSECAKFLGVDTIDYDLAIFENSEGVISKSYHKKGYNYTSGTKILLKYILDNNYGILEDMGFDKSELEKKEFDIVDYINNLEIIWQALEQRYKKIDIRKLIDKFILFFMFNILIGQIDGMAQNWEIEENDKEIDLVPFYDGSSAFYYDEEFDDPYGSLSTNFKDKNRNNYVILEEFLNISSTEYINLFLAKYELLDYNNFISIIEKVENKIEIGIPNRDKQNIIESYLKNRENIEMVISKISKSRKRVK